MRVVFSSSVRWALVLSLIFAAGCASDAADADKTETAQLSSELLDSGWSLLTLEDMIGSDGYSNNFNHSWTVEAPEGAERFRIHFNFAEVERNYDFIRIYDGEGTLVQTITGEFYGWSQDIMGSEARIELTSDYSITDRGFNVDAVSYKAQPAESDGEWITHTYQERERISTVHPYTNHYRETWTIGPMPDASHLRVNFTNFSTEAHYDFVYLYNAAGERVAAYDGALGDFTSVAVEGNTLTVEIISDYSITRSGFDIFSFDQHVEQVGCRSDADCGDNATCQQVMCIRAPCPALCMPNPEPAGRGVLESCDDDNTCQPGLSCSNLVAEAGSACSEPQWSTREMQPPVGTPHPYSNDYERLIHVGGPAWVTELIVNFDNFDMEHNYDFAYLQNALDEELSRYHGELGDFESEVVPGNYAAIRVETDYSVTRYGFDITSFQVNGAPDQLIAMVYEPVQCGSADIMEPTEDAIRAAFDAQGLTFYGYAYHERMRDNVCEACNCARGDGAVVLVEPSAVNDALALGFNLFSVGEEVPVDLANPVVVQLVPRQCLTNPWDQWWLNNRGDIEGDERARIQAWAAEALEIAVHASWSVWRPIRVCLACNCSRGDELFVLVSADDAVILRDSGAEVVD